MSFSKNISRPRPPPWPQNNMRRRWRRFAKSGNHAFEAKSGKQNNEEGFGGLLGLRLLDGIYRLRKNSGFVSGYRFSDDVNFLKSDAPLGAGHRKSNFSAASFAWNRKPNGKPDKVCRPPPVPTTHSLSRIRSPTRAG